MRVPYCDSFPLVAGRIGRGSFFSVLDSHFPACHHEPGRQGTPIEQAYHGRFHALPGKKNSYGAWPRAGRSAKKPFVATTFGFFTLFPLVLLFCRSFAWLVPAFILRGLKEFGEPTRKALIMDLAPEYRKAGMFGLYYLLRDTVVSVAAFGGAFLWEIRPSVNFMVAFAFDLLGTLGFALWGKNPR